MRTKSHSFFCSTLYVLGNISTVFHMIHLTSIRWKHFFLFNKFHPHFMILRLHQIWHSQYNPRSTSIPSTLRICGKICLSTKGKLVFQTKGVGYNSSEVHNQILPAAKHKVTFPSEQREKSTKQNFSERTCMFLLYPPRRAVLHTLTLIHYMCVG